MRAVAVVLLISLPVHAFVIRARGVALERGYKGALPEIRVENNGRIRLGSCHEACQWKVVGRLSGARVSAIRREVIQIARLPAERWFSGAVCAKRPEYQMTYEALGGRIFLGVGDTCLGGGFEKSGARSVIRLLLGYLPAER